MAVAGLAPCCVAELGLRPGRSAAAKGFREGTRATPKALSPPRVSGAPDGCLAGQALRRAVDGSLVGRSLLRRAPLRGCLVLRLAWVPQRHAASQCGVCIGFTFQHGVMKDNQGDRCKEAQAQAPLRGRHCSQTGRQVDVCLSRS